MKILKSVLVGLLVASSIAAAAPPAITFSVTPASGTSPLTPTATWNSPSAVTCTASATPADLKWIGTIANSGTAILSPINNPATYTITCYNANDNVATLSWLAPTLNTDGTTLTDLAGFKVYEVLTSGPVLILDIPNPLTLTMRVTNLNPGTHSFYVTAYKTGNVGESAQSNTGSKTILSPESASQVASVSPTKKAAPPTLLIAQ